MSKWARKGLVPAGFALLLIALSLFAWRAGDGCLLHAETPVIVVFRYDDYCAKGNVRVATALLEMFRARSLQLSVGVIPLVVAGSPHDPTQEEFLPLGDERTHLLRNAVNAGVVDPCLHGLTHRTHTAEWISEFRGLPQEEQVERIRQGRSFLQDALNGNVSTFVPPWNSYDGATVAALESLGFERISADVYGEIGGRIQFFPTTCTLPDLPRAIREAKKSGAERALVVVVFHQYDFVENGGPQGHLTFADFQRLLDQVTATEAVAVLSIQQAAERGAVPDPDAIARHRTTKLTRLLPPGLGHESAYLPLGVHPVPAVPPVVLGLVVYALVGLGAALCCAHWPAHRRVGLVWVTRAVLAAFLAVPLFYALRGALGLPYAPAWVFAAVGVLLGGALGGLLCAGLFACSRRPGRQ